jgi:hypothetical protein
MEMADKSVHVGVVEEEDGTVIEHRDGLVGVPRVPVGSSWDRH